MQLNKSGVRFDQATHTYTTPEGKTLQGITGMLGRQLFPDKYTDVPEWVLQRAKARGTFVHETCELIDELGIDPPTDEGRGYVRLCREHSLRHEASEYLVSDGTHFASSIDKVYRENDTDFTLADIKTTWKLDTEYVSWQLSVYAYLFERQNPDARAVRLLALWLRDDKAEAVEVARIPDETIAALLAAEAEGRQFEGAPAPKPCGKDDLPRQYESLEEELVSVLENLKHWEERKKEITDRLTREMRAAQAWTWHGSALSFVRRKATVRQGFDREAFDKAHPGVYDKFLKASPVAESLTVKPIKQK